MVRLDDTVKTGYTLTPFTGGIGCLWVCACVVVVGEVGSRTRACVCVCVCVCVCLSVVAPCLTVKPHSDWSSVSV